MARRTSYSTPTDDDVFADDDEADRLPHISDREDTAAHEMALLQSVLPSSAGPSPNLRRMSRMSSVAVDSRKGSVTEMEMTPTRVRSNSTSTLFVKSTVSQPNLEDTLRCVALALHYIIVDGHQQKDPVLLGHKFDEKKFPLTDQEVPSNYHTAIPADEEIYTFMHQLFNAAALSAECGIITLVYVNRAIMYTSLTLHAVNWKRVLLGAILMASKVWDDQAVWNVDFCSIMPKIAVDDMNDLERTFLEMLKFNINVDSSVYTKYYFELRELAEEAHRSFPLEPLSRERAQKLEAMSSRASSVASQSQMRNAKSLDFKEVSSRAVIN